MFFGDCALKTLIFPRNYAICITEAPGRILTLNCTDVADLMKFDMRNEKKVV